VIPTFTAPYDLDEEGQHREFRIGWASWDRGKYKDRSIKFAYRDKGGKISRGSPEVPFSILVDMIIVALEQGELSPEEVIQIKEAFRTA